MRPSTNAYAILEGKVGSMRSVVDNQNTGLKWKYSMPYDVRYNDMMGCRQHMMICEQRWAKAK
jgi:hypothetical protein